MDEPNTPSKANERKGTDRTLLLMQQQQQQQQQQQLAVPFLCFVQVHSRILCTEPKQT